ncbi:MAG: hypothetical protein PHS54_00700 [Clostridia bacterium]|nr:hypothetical protein [Clostridia bacterium]
MDKMLPLLKKFDDLNKQMSELVKELYANRVEAVRILNEANQKVKDTGVDPSAEVMKLFQLAMIAGQDGLYIRNA